MIATTVAGPPLLALDFDGVICDGLSEYFQTSWRVYQQIEGVTTDPPADLEPCFQRLRPVIETGWEMPVLLYALLNGAEEATMLRSWSQIAPQILKEQEWDRGDLAHQIDQTRDRWIQSDLSEWIGYHRLYPGVYRQLSRWLADGFPQIWIITTKEGRFAHQILAAQGIDMPRDRILGKEVGVPKSVSLRRLLSLESQIWFIEDRLKTLQSVQAETDLSSVRLFLADWGYVTMADREQARTATQITLLTLDRFQGSFEHWID